MSNEALAVIYKPDQYADDYLVFVEDEDEYKQWKAQPEGGKDIALARFVGNFQIYKSTVGGVTGRLEPISKQDMETAFFSDDKKVKDKSTEAAMVIILQNGRAQRHNFKLTGPEMNMARGGAGDVFPGTQRR